jgi:hypothetical protein
LARTAVRSLIIARKKLVGQRVTLENQIRGLAVVFGIGLPRAFTAASVNQALKASEGDRGFVCRIGREGRSGRLSPAESWRGVTPGAREGPVKWARRQSGPPSGVWMVHGTGRA